MKEVVREYYESHRISFADLAKQSDAVFNFKVTIDQLKKWSAEDGGWKKKEVNEPEKLRIIAEKIFNAIEEEDLHPKDLAQLANTYLSIQTKAPPEKADKIPANQAIMDIVNRELKR
jgi:hypothetical protein